MNRFFRDGWDFGVFTLVIGLPIAAVFLFVSVYMVGAGVWEFVSNPGKHWLFWLFVVVWWGPTLIKQLRKLSSSTNTESDARG